MKIITDKDFLKFPTYLR